MAAGTAGPASRLAPAATALFGGSFDPPHLGHLVLAERVADWAGLDRIHFVPAGRPPHKEGRTVAPAADRLAMVERAIVSNPRFAASGLELGGEGPSYTIDTVRRLAGESGGPVALIIGADSLVEMRSWRDPEALVAACRLLVVERPGWDLGRAPAELRERAVVVPAPLIEISSSEIRARVRAGHSIRYLVPEAIRAYIAEHGLYRGA